MTESKSPPSNRIPRPNILPPAALGHTYSGNQFQTPLRHKISQALQSTGVSAAASPAFHVSVPLGPSKDQLTVVTSYPPKPNSSGPPMIRAFPNRDKLTLNSPSEMRIKASVKNVEIQNVSYVKQVVGSTVKSIVTSSPSVVQATIKKDSDIGKVRPVLLSQGLRQPLKPHQIPKANVVIDPHRIIPRSTSHAQRWTGSPSEARNKAPFQNANVAINNPHDLSKKHVVPQQPKSTINVTAAAQLPLRDAAHRPAGFPVTPLSSGNKQIYQVLTTDLQPQGNAIKKISAMIVCQPSSISVNNSISTSAGFVSSNNALTSGHITIMTSSDSVTYSNPLNGTSISTIPVAKVYPQQQVSAASRIAVTSTTASRLSAPAMSSIGPSINRTNPLIQVGPIKSTASTSIIIPSQPAVMSTIPVAVSSKSPANSGSILCWSSYSQTFALSTVTSSPSSRPNLTHSSSHTQALPSTGIRVQPPNLLLVEPKTTHLQASIGTPSQPTIQGNSPSQAGVSATTPTQSPKPTILRRQRPENNSALKKLTFGSASLPAHRRDIHTKALDRRHMPYPLSRTKNAIDGKIDIPLVIHSDKNEIKPVLENQVFVKQHIAGVGAPLKIVSNPNAKGLASPSSNSAKDGGSHAYSVHPVLDSKGKLETLPNPKVSIKTEPASASQMLQLQNQSMHTYAAESPPVSNVQHRTVSQESGYHVTTNTIFTKPVAMYSGQQHSARTKPSQLIKAASIPHGVHAQEGQHKFGSHTINSFTSHRTPNFSSDKRITQHDYVKKEPTKLKPVPGLEIKQLPDPHMLNPAVSNHILTTSSPAKSWTSMNLCDGPVGLSPRKRPRKQTHVVSEDQPVVMEDEELTDDADECEDEPAVKLTASQFGNPSASAIVPVKLSESKVIPVTSMKSIKNEPPNNKTHLDDTRSKTKNVKTEQVPASSETKLQSEYTDRNGVRYVVSRKRPSVSVLNKAKQNSRSINNHFMHYSDVRAKDKKTTIADLATDKKRLKGYNVARFALQLQDMVSCEKDVWERMKTVFDGLVEYKSAHLSDSSFESLLGTLSPVTPSSLSNSFRKATPRTGRSSSGSGIVENGISQSPSTPLGRKSNKLKDDILNIEELAQANIQRCRVVCDQLSDTKTMLLKAIDHRQLVTDILDSTNNQKSTTSHLQSNQNSSKRLKKKTNS